MIIADPKTFALEFELKSTPPPFGRLRFWFSGLFVGDWQRQDYFFPTGNLVHGLLRRSSSAGALVYSRSQEVPPAVYDLETSLSLGDNFDDFFFQLYAVMGEERIHAVWRLSEERQALYPGYPLGIHRAAIGFAEFDPVAGRFLRESGLERYFNS